jgi:hypothetical protein
MKFLFSISTILLTLAAAHAQHIHINAGALDTNHSGIPDIGEPLYFENGSALAAAFELTVKTAGTYAGYFSGNITFTALPATEELGGP